MELKVSESRAFQIYERGATQLEREAGAKELEECCGAAMGKYQWSSWDNRESGAGG